MSCYKQLIGMFLMTTIYTACSGLPVESGNLEATIIAQNTEIAELEISTLNGGDLITTPTISSESIQQFQ